MTFKDISHGQVLAISEDPITDAATFAWTQYVANSPDETFTPRDRQIFMVAFGMCLVGMKAAESG